MHRNSLPLMQRCFKVVYSAILVFIIFSNLADVSYALSTIRPVSQNESRFFESIIKIHTGEYAENGFYIKIFERGGGDPAYNGTSVFLTIMFEEQARTWNLGLNVRKIRKIDFKPGNTIFLSVDEDRVDKSGKATLENFTYTVHFDIIHHILQETVSIDTDTPLRSKAKN